MSTFNVLPKDRMILYYPNILAEDEAELFLDRQEQALRRVEEFLQLEYPSRVKLFLQISALREHWVSSDGIHYSFPLLELQQIFRKKDASFVAGELHELTHFIAQELLAPAEGAEPPAFFLIEGLAMAVDATANSQEAICFHLVAKGLSLLRSLKPVFQIAPIDPPIFRYDVMGSFTCFLLEQYGIEKLKELYTFIDKKDFESAVARIYGKPLLSLEQEWHGFLTSLLSGQEERARYIALASLEFNRVHDLSIIKHGNQ